MNEKELDSLILQRKPELDKEIDEFAEVGKQFLNGDISVPEFKGKSGGMGLYAQRGGKSFMLRLRTLSGVTNLNTLKLILGYVKQYDLDYIHFTTRQAIQLHNLDFNDLITIMHDSLSHDLISRGGGGNFPRNVALSPLAGVDPAEAFDVTPYAICVNKYFLTKIRSYHLPRKLKVAFSNVNEDSANATIADMGFIAVEHENQQRFQLYIGGGLGNNPQVGVRFPGFVEPCDVLYHVEAITQLFIAEGDYENKAKARIRYILKRMGEEQFVETYMHHLEKVKEEYGDTLRLDTESFTEYEFNEKIDIDSIDAATQERLSSEQDVFVQKQTGYYTVNVHPLGGIYSANDFDALVAFLDKTPQADCRLSMEESIYVHNLTAQQACELLDMTKSIRHSSRLSHSISCIGAPICQIGLLESQELLKNIYKLLIEEHKIEDNYLPEIHISGCTNSCSRHQAAEIGFQGKKKRVDGELIDVFTLFVGGHVYADQSSLGEAKGDIPAERIPEFLLELWKLLKENNMEFLAFYQSKQQAFDELLSRFAV